MQFISCIAMSKSQIKLRIDDDVIFRLRAKSSDRNMSFNALCNQILIAGIEPLGESLLIVPATLLIKLDRLAASLRAIERKLQTLLPTGNELYPS
jgi:hypothetical protein